MLDQDYSSVPIPQLPLPTTISYNETRETTLTWKDHVDGNKMPGKSVVINEPPYKRQRVTPATSTRQVIEVLNFCVVRTDREAAIASVCESFDHNVEAYHNEEIDYGADAALCKHLALLLLKESNEAQRMKSNKKKFNQDDYRANSHDGTSKGYTEEISRTVEALEMVYRCSANYVSSSFTRVGLEILPLLLGIINKELCCLKDSSSSEQCEDVNTEEDVRPKRTTSDSTLDSTMSGSEKKSQKETFYVSNQNTSSPNLLRKCTKIIGHFARVGSATETMAYHPDLLSTLKNIIDSQSDFVPSEARLNSLWIIANLACNTENMVMMACTPGLMDTLVKQCRFNDDKRLKHPESFSDYIHLIRAQSIAARAMLNLSWAPENKIPMFEVDNLVDSLITMLLTRTSEWGGRGHGVSTFLLQSRRHASGALRNLAAAPRRNKFHLCKHGNGSLLNSLLDAARNDPDTSVKTRVLATLHNLTCADSAEILISEPGLLDLLSELATANETTGNTEDELGTLAFRTLRTMEKAASSDMSCHDSLQKVLNEVSATRNSTVLKPVKTESSAE